MPLDPKQQPPYYTPGTPGQTLNKYIRLNTQYNVVQTVGTTETDLYTYTIPANTLITNGDVLKITFTAVQNTPVEDHTQRFYFDGTEQFTITSQLNSYTIIEVTIIRTGTTTAVLQFQHFSLNTLAGPYIQIDGTVDFTTTIPIKFTGECTGLAFIQTIFMTIDKIII